MHKTLKGSDMTILAKPPINEEIASEIKRAECNENQEVPKFTLEKFTINPHTFNATLVILPADIRVLKNKCADDTWLPRKALWTVWPDSVKHQIDIYRISKTEDSKVAILFANKLKTEVTVPTSDGPRVNVSIWGENVRLTYHGKIDFPDLMESHENESW